MSDETPQNQGEINRQLDETNLRLQKLAETESDAVEELKNLTVEQEKYTALRNISDQLEELEKLGGADLFWGDGYDTSITGKHLQSVKHLVSEYETRFTELQNKVNAREETFASLNAKISLLNDEALQLQLKKEDAAADFIIERETTILPFRELNMPWNRNAKDQKDFRKILLVVLFFTCLLGVLVPMWNIPVPDRIEVVEVPKRLAKLMLAKKTPPPPPKVEKKKEKKEAKKDEKKKQKEVEKKIEEPKPEKVTEPAPAPEPVITKRKKAERAGLMAFKDDFADLINDTTDVKLGSAATISGKGNKAKKATRSLVTSSVGSASSGINTAALSRSAGGGGKEMAGVGFSRVESSIGEGKFSGEDRPLSGDGAAPSRTDEEIQIVFDRYKSALYRIYNRELRKNPTLQGKMVLRLTIEPDGRVSACSVDSSDMDSASLDEGIAARVRKFKFGAKDGVPTVTILYPIDFLPAS